MGEQEAMSELRSAEGMSLHSRVSAAKASDVYAQVGEHVASVIRAAETAAAALSEQADSEAAAIRNAALAEAAQMVKDAQAEAEQLRAKASELGKSAKAEAEKARQEADAYAAQRRRDADEAAAKVLQEAEQAAAGELHDALAREEAQRRAIARTEQRLGDLAGGLHDLARHLEELVAGEAESVAEALNDAVTTKAAKAQTDH
jgi:hypothetical protein